MKSKEKIVYIFKNFCYIIFRYELKMYSKSEINQHMKELLEKRNFLYCDNCEESDIEKEYFLVKEREDSNSQLFCEKCIYGGIQ